MSEKSEVESDEVESVSTEELQRELDGQKKRVLELETRLKYAQADLENYRKRADKELREAGDSVARSLVGRLIVVQDELELAVKHAKSGAGGKEMLEGVAMVQRNLLSALQAVGVEKIEAVGRPFDPAVHEAVAKVQGDGAGPDLVVEEVRPGFALRGQVLRPSMVKVELASKSGQKEAKRNE